MSSTQDPTPFGPPQIPPPPGSGLPPQPPPTGGGGRRLGPLLGAGVAIILLLAVVLVVVTRGGDDSDAGGINDTVTDTVNGDDRPESTEPESTEPESTEPESTEPDETVAPPERMMTSGGSELTFGAVHPGQLVSEADVGRYEFEGRAGETVRIVLLSADARVFNPEVLLLGPDGALVGENGDVDASNRNSELSIALDAAGSHTVEVRSTRGAGAYEITIEVDDHLGDADTPTETYTADEQLLWERIPDAADDICWSHIPEGDAIAEFICTPERTGEPFYTYTLYPDAESLNSVYENYRGNMNVPPDTGDSTQCPAEFGYSVGDVSVGNAVCFLLDGEVRIVYTSTCDQNILVYAGRNDADHAALWPLWRDTLGPLCPDG